MGNCLNRDGFPRNSLKNEELPVTGIEQELIDQEFQALNNAGDYRVQIGETNAEIASIIANYKFLSQVTFTQNIERSLTPRPV